MECFSSVRPRAAPPSSPRGARCLPPAPTAQRARPPRAARSGAGGWRRKAAHRAENGSSGSCGSRLAPSSHCGHSSPARVLRGGSCAPRPGARQRVRSRAHTLGGGGAPARGSARPAACAAPPPAPPASPARRRERSTLGRWGAGASAGPGCTSSGTMPLPPARECPAADGAASSPTPMTAPPRARAPSGAATAPRSTMSERRPQRAAVVDASHARDWSRACSEVSSTSLPTTTARRGIPRAAWSGAGRTGSHTKHRPALPHPSSSSCVPQRHPHTPPPPRSRIPSWLPRSLLVPSWALREVCADKIRASSSVGWHVRPPAELAGRRRRIGS